MTGYSLLLRDTVNAAGSSKLRVRTVGVASQATVGEATRHSRKLGGRDFEVFWLAGRGYTLDVLHGTLDIGQVGGVVDDFGGHFKLDLIRVEFLVSFGFLGRHAFEFRNQFAGLTAQGLVIVVGLVAQLILLENFGLL